ncbi:MAG: FixH family protein [Deltaproteobacteria bacterium]|nr:FixH family protein [Deltaproteobacteria bacterium]
MNEAKKTRNWWPMLPVFVLGATVLANIVLIRLATNTEDTLLADDYYQQGLAEEAAITEKAADEGDAK